MIRRVASPLLAAAALALFVTGSASAQSLVPDQRTFFTFSAPVQLPGVTLPAGKYTFRLADSPSNRHIVQVFNADGTKIITTLFAIAAQRNEVPDNAEIQFLETPANVPAAIDVWWYPGTKTGHEFMYPKDTAAKFAKAKSGSEKYAKGEAAPASMTFANSDAAAEAPKADADRTPARPAPAVTTPRPEPAPPVASSVRPEATMADSSMNARANRSSLPRTASSMPTIALIGALSLFAAALVAVRRRIA